MWYVNLYVIFQLSIFQLESIPWRWIAFLEYSSIWRMYVVLKWLSNAFYKKMWNFTDNFVWPILTLKELAAFAYFIPFRPMSIQSSCMYSIEHYSIKHIACWWKYEVGICIILLLSWTFYISKWRIPVQ